MSLSQTEKNHCGRFVLPNYQQLITGMKITKPLIAGRYHKSFLQIERNLSC